MDAEAAYVGSWRAFCDALRSSTVANVVGVSALGRRWPKPAGHVTASTKMDDMIGETGVHYRALACASLMDNRMRQTALIRDAGLISLPTPGDLKLPPVAKADVAAVAVGLLLQPDWQGVEEVPVCGPGSLSCNEMALFMSNLLAPPIRFQKVPMDDFVAIMKPMGASEGIARSYAEMFAAKNERMDALTPARECVLRATRFRTCCDDELRPGLAILTASIRGWGMRQPREPCSTIDPRPGGPDHSRQPTEELA